MKFFWRYVFPPLYGLLTYFTIPLLHDPEGRSFFWKRSWRLNSIEMGSCIVMGYAAIYLFRRLFNYYDRRWPVQLRYQHMVRELMILVLANLVLANLILTPMAAFTDDGLSTPDLINICSVPTLYAVMYYGIARSRSYLIAFIKNEVLLEKLTNDHLVTELKFLKAQYHPHFLFNALNAIYFQMDENLPGAKISIEKFSELLRYQLYDQQHQVPIIQELTYLENFINLQKLRSNNQLQLTIDMDKLLDNQLVYPLLFLPLVENAFKFVGGNYRLSIHAVLRGEQIYFRVENTMSETQPKVVHQGGIGLENLKRRLDLLYPGKHSLETRKERNTFVAELNLVYE